MIFSLLFYFFSLILVGLIVGYFVPRWLWRTPSPLPLAVWASDPSMTLFSSGLSYLEPSFFCALRWALWFVMSSTAWSNSCSNFVVADWRPPFVSLSPVVGSQQTIWSPSPLLWYLSTLSVTVLASSRWTVMLGALAALIVFFPPPCLAL